MSDCRILIVDDDPFTLDIVDDFLRDEGYVTLRATNGEEALHVATQASPNLILLDWWLPDVSGQEVARLLRARGVKAPIVAFTAAVFPRDWVPDPNVTSYFAKPFELTDLLALVESHCPPEPAAATA